MARTLRANLDSPAHITERHGRWVILDGVEALVRPRLHFDPQPTRLIYGTASRHGHVIASITCPIDDPDRGRDRLGYSSRSIRMSTARSVRSSSQSIRSSPKARVFGFPQWEPIASVPG